MIEIENENVRLTAVCARMSKQVSTHEGVQCGNVQFIPFSCAVHCCLLVALVPVMLPFLVTDYTVTLPSVLSAFVGAELVCVFIATTAGAPFQHDHDYMTASNGYAFCRPAHYHFATDANYILCYGFRLSGDFCYTKYPQRYLRIPDSLGGIRTHKIFSV